MRVLVACEESQRVCIEFRRLGHEAYSCDIEPCSGGHEEWHIQDDVLPLLNGNCEFQTVDGAVHRIDGKWDMIIAFPPCTHLAVSGARYFKEKRKDGRQKQGIDFFMQFVNAECEKIAIENPVGIMSTEYRKPDQTIQPWQFGHGETKKTCLWLKGLPKLTPTNIVDGREQRIWKMAPGKDRAKERSKTFPGIAKAMAEQWGYCGAKWIDRLNIAMQNADKFPYAKSYESIRKKIEQSASFGMGSTVFDGYYVDEKTRDKLKGEGLEIEELCYGKIRISWNKENRNLQTTGQ